MILLWPTDMRHDVVEGERAAAAEHLDDDAGGTEQVCVRFRYLRCIDLKRRLKAAPATVPDGDPRHAVPRSVHDAGVDAEHRLRCSSTVKDDVKVDKRGLCFHFRHPQR